MSTYTAAFVIPASANKSFDEYGWSFETEDRLHVEVLDALKTKFCLEETEMYLGIDAYKGNGVKVNVSYDEKLLIKEIFIQLWSLTSDQLKTCLADISSNVEIFIPSEN